MKYEDLKKLIVEEIVTEYTGKRDKEAGADTPVKKLDSDADYGEIKDKLDDDSLEVFCKEMEFLQSGDEKAKALYDTLKAGWKKEYGKVKIDPNGVITVKDFHPTQNVIFTKKSIVPFVNGKFKMDDGTPAIKAVLEEESPTVTLGQKLIVCEINDEKYIIDGHHRWSKVYMFNPNAKMDAYIIDGTKFFNSSAEEVLKFSQGTLAMFTDKSPIKEQPSDDVNIYKISESEFNKIITDNTTDEILEIIVSSPVTKGKVKDRQSLCKYLWENKKNMPKPWLDHDREYMPQFPEAPNDNPANPVDKIEPEGAKQKLDECRKFKVNNYQGNLLESLNLFKSQKPDMKVVKVCEENGTLRIFAK